MTNVCLIKIEDIKENSVIEMNVSDRLISNTLIDVQDTIIEEVITESLYTALISGITNNTLQPLYSNLILNYIQKPLVAGVVVYLIDNLTFKWKQQGINKAAKTNQSPIETLDIQDLTALKNEKLKIMNYHLDKLKRYLNLNIDSFPEYKQGLKNRGRDERLNMIDSVDHDSGIFFYSDLRSGRGSGLANEFPYDSLYNAGEGDEYGE